MVMTLDQSPCCRHHNKGSVLRPGRILIICLLGLIGLRLFVLLPVRVVSESMLPTLRVGDILLADITCYGLRLPFFHTRILNTGSPQRGDIVLFAYPLDKHQVYLKRIIGLPGDVIVLKGHSLFLNGRQVIVQPVRTRDRTALQSSKHFTWQGEEKLGHRVHAVMFDGNGSADRATRRFKVPTGAYFVLGDNRDHSVDSRKWGFVPNENLIGRPFVILFSWDASRHRVEWARTGMTIH